MSNFDTSPLTADPDRHPFAFERAFNSSDPDVLDRLYEDAGILIAPDGRVTSGADRRQANAELMALGIPISVRPRHVYRTGDLALLIVDWSITGTAADGRAVDVRGTATDIARRGADGHWRYVVDNPWGTEQPVLAAP